MGHNRSIATLDQSHNSGSGQLLGSRRQHIVDADLVLEPSDEQRFAISR